MMTIMIKSSVSVFVALLLCCCCTLGNAFVVQQHLGLTRTTTKTKTTSLLEMAKKDKEDDGNIDDDKNKVTLEEMDWETWQQEQEASRKVSQNLGMGQNFGAIVWGLGLAIIVGGFALEQFGYDYVIKDGRVTIGTIEERQFQKEVTKDTKTASQQQQLLQQSSTAAVQE